MRGQQHMIRQVARVALPGMILALVLAGCGGGEDNSPALVAIATRTPAPVTDAPADNAPQADASATVAVEFVSLRDGVRAYLDAAAETNSAFLLDALTQHVITPYQDCFTWPVFPDMQPMELLSFNLISTDNEGWATVVEGLPEEALRGAVESAFAEAAALLPPAGPLRVCLLPAPLARTRDGEPVEQSGQSVTLGGDLIMVVCADPVSCADNLRQDLIYNYAYAYQVAVTGWNWFDSTLLHKAIWLARAGAFAQAITGTAPEWAGALTPEQEAAVWAILDENRDLRYQDYPAGRTVDDTLFGGRPAARYPAWGGLFVADQILSAYRVGHPDVTWADLMALPPEDVLAQSGYPAP